MIYINMYLSSFITGLESLFRKLIRNHEKSHKEDININTFLVYQ